MFGGPFFIIAEPFLELMDQEQSPPVPEWQPAIRQPLDKIIERMQYYTDGKRDFALFENGTCVIITDDLSESDAKKEAVEVLSQIFNYHPDMNPLPMDDGNVVVQYNHPAFNVVLDEVVRSHWDEIDSNHQKALATHEVLITPQGSNVFDDFGKKALFGRCFMYMDAQQPKVVQIIRRSTAA